MSSRLSSTVTGQQQLGKAVPTSRGWFGKRNQTLLGDTLTWIVLGVVGISMIFPLYWMVSTSLKSEPELYEIPPRLIPQDLLWSNYLVAFRTIPYWQMLWNSTFVALIVTVGRVITSTFAGFAFARLQFPGRNTLFLTYLAVLMIPFPVTMVPLYLIMRSLGWLDTYTALILPPFVSAYNTFLVRQFMLSLPGELEDAARIDGASPPLIYARVIMPLCKPVVAAITIFSFLTSWNSFIWPLLVLSSPDKLTVPIGLAIIATGRDGYGGYIAWNYLMAAATASAIPMILVFLVAQRQFVQGIALTGLKG